MWKMKLRAWDGEKMRTDFFLSANGVPCRFICDEKSIGPRLEVVNWTVMILTGRDKNGDDIYDGDILSEQNEIIGHVYDPPIGNRHNKPETPPYL